MLLTVKIHYSIFFNNKSIISEGFHWHFLHLHTDIFLLWSCLYQKLYLWFTSGGNVITQVTNNKEHGSQKLTLHCF